MHLHAFVSQYYDNNILNYSDSDRTLYKETSSSGGNTRFAVETLDDNVIEVGARFTYESSGRKSSMWRARLKGSADLFARNSFRNYSQWGLELRKYISRSYIEFSLSWLPYYNLRNLYWQPQFRHGDTREYMPAEFRRTNYALEVGASFSRQLDGRVSIGLSSTNYKFPFDERDNTTFTESGRLGYDVSKRITLYGGFGFAQSRAAGRDSTSQFFGGVKDISYNAILAEFGARVKCDRRGRIVASGSFDYQHQHYRSRKQYGDKGHYGRIDHDRTFDLSLSWRVTNRWQPKLNYVYHSSTSNVSPGTTDFGSYTAYHVGAMLTVFF